MIPDHIINKILLYNIHPIAEIFKPIFLSYKNNYDNIYEYVFDNYSKYGCWFCHIISDDMINTTDKHFCENCWLFVDSNDDVIQFTSFELIEIKALRHLIY